MLLKFFQLFRTLFQRVGLLARLHSTNLVVLLKFLLHKYAKKSLDLVLQKLVFFCSTVQWSKHKVKFVEMLCVRSAGKVWGRGKDFSRIISVKIKAPGLRKELKKQKTGVQTANKCTVSQWRKSKVCLRHFAVVPW